MNQGDLTMKIQELMSKKVQSITPGASVTEAARTMRDLDIGSLPVMEGNELLGIITDRDICCRVVGENHDPETTEVRTIMSTDIASCFSDQDVAEAAHLMEGKHIRRLAILQRDNSVAGILSVDDLARCSHDLAGEVLEAAGPMH
jgi:CBS domain-containing protein